MLLKFTVPLTPISKKNHMKIVRFGNRPGLVQSDRYKQYERDCAFYIPRMEKPIADPVNVQMIFYMPTKRKVDLSNLQAAILDIMVKYGVLLDDHYNIVASMDGSRVFYDKENPRTEVEIVEIWEVEDG